MIWDTLKIGGVDQATIKVPKIVYINIKHVIKVKGSLFEGMSVHLGVRQGCPLSGILYALCLDILLVKMRQLLTGIEEYGALADDIAAAMLDYRRLPPCLAHLFQDF